MERIWGEACFGLNDYQAAIPPLERYRESVSTRSVSLCMNSV